MRILITLSLVVSLSFSAGLFASPPTKSLTSNQILAVTCTQVYTDLNALVQDLTSTTMTVGEVKDYCFTTTEFTLLSSGNDRAILIATDVSGTSYSTEGQGGLGEILPAGDYTLQVNAIAAGQTRIVFETETNGRVADEILTIVAALPIELIGFTAQATAKQVELAWETAQESQNASFHIQHTTDAQNWSDISMIPGAGNSSEPKDYLFVHQNPVAGTNHYRLRQTDFDGTSTYSQVRTVVFAYAEISINAYPNPATDFVTVILPESFQTGQLQLYSANGQVVREQSAGNSKLSTAGLSTGTYIIQVKAKEGILQHKLIVQ